MSDDTLRALREVQEHFRLPSVGLVEKDLYVVKAIAALAAIDAAPFTLVFGGGTALARAHKIIRRMSEDVDFKIVPLAGSTRQPQRHPPRAGQAGDQVTAALARGRLCVRSEGQSLQQIPEREPLYGLATALRRRKRGRGGAAPDDPDRD